MRIGNALTNPAAATVTTTPALLVSATGARKSLLIQNLGATDIYIGSSTVTAATGIKVAASGGEWSEDQFVGAVYAATASGSSTDVRVQEVR